MTTHRRKAKRKVRGSISLKLDPIKDKDLFDWVELQRLNEANISDLLRKGLRLIMQDGIPDSAPIDVETLRAELGSVVEQILFRMPRMVAAAPPSGRTLTDVNDKGRNIPDF